MNSRTTAHVLAALFLIAAFSNHAYADDFKVTRIPAPGGEVVFANPDEREVMYDQLTYSDNTVVEIQVTAYAPEVKQ